MTHSPSNTATAHQIRPNTPDSCPLLWEKADEVQQPKMRIMHGFTPQWFRKRMGLDYKEPWHTDVELRRNSLIEMKHTLNQTFPSLRLGGRSDEEIDSLGGTLSVINGTTLIASILGSGIHYMADNWPANRPAEMTQEEAESMAVPDLEDNAAFQDLVRQMDELEDRYGKIEGVLNFQGVMNNAFRVRGQGLFIDLIANPERAHHVFEVVSETMINVIKAVYARQNGSGVERDFFVTSNCVVNMISGAHYEEFLLPYDKRLSNAFTYFGIHNCAWNVDAYIDGYSEIDDLGYLDFGIDSDMERIAEVFPKARRCMMYSPISLESQTLEQIAADLQNVHDALGHCEIIVTDIEDTCPDERVLDFYKISGEIWDMDPRDLVPKTISR